MPPVNIDPTTLTISAHDREEMKKLTDSFAPHIYAAFCCFRPIDTSLRCRLNHLNFKSSKVITFQYQQNDRDVDLLCQKVTKHMYDSHHFNISSFKGKKWISDGVNYISFEQMVI